MSTAEDIYVLDKRVRLRQPVEGFRTGLDAVMLAAACQARAGEHILDLGCGVGGAGLSVLYRVPDTHLTGVDIQDDHIELAKENAALNKMSERTAFICADVRDFREQRFNHVICNPPYMEAGAHAPSPSEKRAKALGHDDTGLEDWIACAFDCLKGQGSLTMIHRADMLDKIIQAIGKRFGALDIIPLWPKAGEPAKRIIIRGFKHKKSPATLHTGLVLHQENGSYTPETEEILRKARPLFQPGSL